jgi:hypothetical protein
MMKKKYLQPETEVLNMGLEQILAASGDYIEVEDNVWENPEDAASRVMYLDMISE